MMPTSTSDNGPLIILGASERAAQEAVSLNCPVIHIQRPGSQIEHLAALGCEVYCVDFATERFADFAHGVLAPQHPAAFVSLSEHGLMPAAEMNDRFELPGTPPEVVGRMRDKALMRRRLIEAGLSALSTRHAEPTDGASAALALSTWGPGSMTILKPRSGTGSREVEFITEPAQLAQRTSLERYILEEFIPGQEYSAETFSVDGTHLLIGVVEKHVDSASFVELAHVTPAQSLSEGDIDVVRRDISTFLDLMGLRDGPAHTEFKFHDDGIKIIESHNRIAGDGITKLVQLVYGVNLVRWALGWPLKVGRQDTEPRADAAAIAFAAAPPGVVSRTSLPPHGPGEVQVEELATFVEVGDVVGALRSSADRVGCAMISGPTAKAALAAAQALAGQITVVTE